MEELEERTREVLPKMAYDYYAGGANDEVALRENRAAYERIWEPPFVAAIREALGLEADHALEICQGRDVAAPKE